jgi:O-antigen ligase
MMSFSVHLIHASVALCALQYFISHKTQRLLFWFPVLLVLGYHALLFVVRPYAVDFGWALGRVELLALFAWCALVQWTPRKSLWVVVPYGVYLIAWGVVEKLAFNPLRVGGPTTYATNYAVLLTVLWTFWFVDALLRRRHSWFTLLVVTLFVFACVLLSGTRMGFLGLGFGLFGGILSRIWVGLLQKPLKERFFFLGFGALGALACITFVWNALPDDLFIVRSWDILLSGNLDASTVGRITLWITAWDAFQKNMLWGIGPTHFLTAHTAFLDSLPDLPILKGVQRLGHAHNIVLNVLAENGLVGFLVLAVVAGLCIFLLLRYLFRHPASSMGYTLLFGGMVLFGLPLVDMIPSPGWEAWFMGMCLSLGLYPGVESLVGDTQVQDEPSREAIGQKPQ